MIQVSKGKGVQAERNHSFHRFFGKEDALMKMIRHLADALKAYYKSFGSDFHA